MFMSCFALSAQHHDMYFLGNNNWKISGHPILGYTPETDIYYGIAGIILWQPLDTFSHQRVATINPFLLKTFNGQFKFVLLNEVYHNKYLFNLRAETGSFPDFFHGIGNNTSDDKGIYELKRSGFEGMVLFKFNQQFYLGPDFRFQYNMTRIIKLHDLFKEYSIDETVEGAVAGMGLAARFDNRDNIFFPSSGLLITLESYTYDKILGSEYKFNQLTLNGKSYTSLFKENHIIAVNSRISILNGNNIPFYALTRIGGENRLRGIFNNRYIDKKSMLIQTEYRYMSKKRVGFVIFGGTGWVGSKINDFTTRELKFCGGSGLRYKVFKNKKINFRFDAGIGSDKQSGFYFGINEAF